MKKQLTELSASEMHDDRFRWIVYRAPDGRGEIKFPYPWHLPWPVKDPLKHLFEAGYVIRRIDPIEDSLVTDETKRSETQGE